MVRVIAGAFKSRVLKTLEGRLTRPTSDRLKESLFNILRDRIGGSNFLDCFAGSGAIGIEALSRGAVHAVFVESNARAARVILENCRRLGLERHADYHLIDQPVEPALRMLGQVGTKFDIVFLDPPYDASDEYSRVLGRLSALDIVKTEGWVIAEHSRRKMIELAGTRFRCFRQIRQGDSILSFFRLNADTEDGQADPTKA
ncbi:MAG: 16S rRNA (guanine(966)-N(2))-methyltransferase RsmD [Acidobacteriota bacterium]